MILLALTAGAGIADAQRIDIDNGQKKTEEGFTSWTFANAATATTTIDGITLKLGIEGTSTGRTLKCEWWKDGVNKYSKLVGDGVGIYALDASNNTPRWA